MDNIIGYKVTGEAITKEQSKTYLDKTTSLRKELYNVLKELKVGNPIN